MWNFFDVIYCINLIERYDKYNNMKLLFDKYNIPVQFYRPSKNKISGTMGCFESHLHLINLAYTKNYNNILIFEDDIDFNYFTNSKLSICIDFMKNNEFDLFFLGSFPEIMNSTIYKTPYTNIYKMNSICGHAYVLNKSYISKIYNSKYIDIPLDYYYKFNTRTYGILPPLVVQTAQNSDINNDYINKNTFLKMCTWFFVCNYAKHINIKISDLRFYLILGLSLYVLLDFIKHFF